MIDLEESFKDATAYGYSFTRISPVEVFKWTVRENPYSWSISYFDDWRCVVDFLRKKASP